MIHFFPMFSSSAADTPFGEGLRRIGVEHRIFAGSVSRAYRSRVELFTRVLPRILGFAVANAWASLVRARPAPDVVVISSDIEALVFGLVRLLAQRRRTLIAFTPFIYTSRPDRRIEWLRRRYYGFVLRAVDVAIVHSRLELTRYPALFPHARTRYVFAPYGLHVTDREALIAAAPVPARPLVVAAGRSGRDYATLLRAVEGLPVDTHIICDQPGLIPPYPANGGVRVLADCHEDALIEEMARASVVVVPLSVADISAGQMVLIQAKALQRPLIVTDTPTTRDYVTDGEDGLLVPLGDAAALRAAIQRVTSEPGLADRLARNAAASYLARHDAMSALRAMVAAVQPPPAEEGRA